MRMLSAFLCFKILSLWILGLPTLMATNYVSSGTGNYDANGAWVGNAPPTVLIAGDSVFINHAILLNQDIIIKGVLIVNASGSLIGSGNSILIGDGTNVGEVYNYGTVNCKKITVDGSGTVNDSLPAFHNIDSVKTGKIDVGSNAPAGLFRNESTGYVLVSATYGDAKGEAHIDGYLQNCGIMKFETKLKNHGGQLSCGGSIYTPLVEFDDNGGRAGTMTNQNLCTDSGSSTQPQFFSNTTGNTYNSISALLVGESPTGSGNQVSGADYSIDSTSFFICGESLDGSIKSGPLPIEFGGWDISGR